MSKLNAGEIEISLNGETRVLKPTLRAMTALSNAYGGLAKLREAIVAQDLMAAVATIRWGLGLGDRDAAKLPDLVFANGLTGELLIALIRFVAILGNGGRPLDDEPDAGAGDGTAGADAGNG